MANNRGRSGNLSPDSGSPDSSSLFNPEDIKNFVAGVGKGGSLTALVGLLLHLWLDR